MFMKIMTTFFALLFAYVFISDYVEIETRAIRKRIKERRKSIMLMLKKEHNDDFKYEIEKLEANEYLIEYTINKVRFVMSFIYDEAKGITRKHIENIDSLTMDQISQAHTYLKMLEVELISICKLMNKLS